MASSGARLSSVRSNDSIVGKVVKKDMELLGAFQFCCIVGMTWLSFFYPQAST